jgi:pimeloyl-ACP methyl ester carboxylesterase
VNSEDKYVEIARALLAPERRAPRPSSVLWDATTKPSANVGPLAMWRAGAGPCIVLVHGWETDHRDMDAFVAPLVAAGRSVVAFDFPAHGESPGETATLPDLAEALAAVCAFAGPVDGIVAHSVGCAATAIALAGGMRVRRAAFVAPPLRYEAFVRAYAERAGADGDALVSALAKLGLDVSPLDLRANAATMDDHIPLLLVHSTDDRVCAVENTHRIAAVWPGATKAIVEGLGHSRILRNEDVVARVRDFLIDEGGSLAAG